ncbi:UDP-N-acetylglucosamine acyltransferase [Candidatus Thioglobus autotrophicus]|uniref:UDP-3-O-acylglucosamine N-acyltransferase n=1 Tax=Candidatus Thioglobus autotrophicus TaxID=1705394 RepID=A0A0M5LEY3_9GAMM|nr:UDP-3-O-(3-hydroxymyristoyl)glucosamine N-acyltransferase [Candidatus Thioglobus autotrophicus]ALE53116.1 UDP-N-acetylglucosamine acyltransferase [Candidatus Thioglobus autotrophicus]
MHTLGEIAKLVNAELVGDGELKITSLASIDCAKSDQLSYVVSEKYREQLSSTQASAVIISKSLQKFCNTNALIVDDVYLAFAQITHLFKHKVTHTNGIHASANTNNATVAPNCCIGKQVSIGTDTTIGANTVIEDNTTIGANCTIGSNISILQGTIIGNNVVVESGAVIGSEGFGNARDKYKRWHSIAHLGNVVIGDDVNIGANTAIDRGTLENTYINRGVRLDNLVHIAHNVTIGEDTAIAACTGIAGSTRIGKRCMIGGMVGVVGHLNICDDVVVNAKSTVDKNITISGVYTGIMPLMPHKKWQIVGVWLTKLDKITQYLNIKLTHLKGK